MSKNDVFDFKKNELDFTASDRETEREREMF